MNRPAWLAELAPFKGQQLIACIDAIKAVAAEHHIADDNVLVIDPEFDTGSIDANPHRLNVHTDGNSIITSFTIG